MPGRVLVFEISLIHQIVVEPLDQESCVLRPAEGGCSLGHVTKFNHARHSLLLLVSHEGLLEVFRVMEAERRLREKLDGLVLPRE